MALLQAHQFSLFRRLVLIAGFLGAMFSGGLIVIQHNQPVTLNQFTGPTDSMHRLVSNTTIRSDGPSVPDTLFPGLQYMAAMTQRPGRWQLTSAEALAGLMAVLFVALALSSGYGERTLVQQYRQLQAEHAALQATERTKTELSSMLVHDLRGPLTTIVCALDVLHLPSVGTLSLEQRRLINQAQGSGERLRDMLNDLLTISKLAEGKLQLRRHPLRPQVALPKMVAEMQPWLTQQHHGLELIVQPAASIINVDGALLQRVIDNLVSNAVHHTPRGSTIRIEARTSDKAFELSVIDNGPGIAAPDLPHIFDRWQQASGHGAGHGIGLSFCRMAIAAHGGSIEVHSTVGLGTTFTLALPIEHTAQPEHRPLSSFTPGRSLRAA